MKLSGIKVWFRAALFIGCCWCKYIVYGLHWNKTT